MRVAAMLVREDFYTILQNTITDYYRKVHNKKITFSYEPEDGCEKLIVNGKLSFVSRFPAPSGLRKFLLAEYNVRGSYLKHIAGKMAALLVGTLPQVGKVKNAYISENALGKNTFISPQNRSIRFFDYDSMTVDCMLKSGFTSKYFANQLAFRKQYQYDFMLPLLDNGEDWFREPILTGHPLARITDEEKYQLGIRAALQGIRQLAEDTLSYEPSEAYAQRLLFHIEALVKQAKEQKHIKLAEQTLKMVRASADAIKAHCMLIPLCMSHGDFQGGNIWVDEENKTWLYDWETAGRRSVWYDSAVLRYSLRRTYGWKMLLDDKSPTQICNCDPEKERTVQAYEVIKHIVLLEDFVFYLEDMLELPSDWGAKIYDDFALRMWELLKEK